MYAIDLPKQRPSQNPLLIRCLIILAILHLAEQKKAGELVGTHASDRSSAAKIRSPAQATFAETASAHVRKPPLYSFCPLISWLDMTSGGSLCQSAQIEVPARAHDLLELSSPCKQTAGVTLVMACFPNSRRIRNELQAAHWQC